MDTATRWVLDHVLIPWRPTLIGLVVVPAILYVGVPSRPADQTGTYVSLSKEQCDRVRVGMTEEEARTALGSFGQGGMLFEGTPEMAYAIVWESEEFTMVVSFNAERRVARVMYYRYRFTC